MADWQEFGARSEPVHESARSRVTRLFRPGGTVISKEPLGLDADRRLHQEMAVLQRLSGVGGLAQLAPTPPRAGAILLADIGGTALAGTAMPWNPGELTELALQLARAVSGMHRRGVLHCDISPANVVVTHPLRGLCLIDFGLATTFERTSHSSVRSGGIVGTLPYLAPELTGRTGRAVDQRADLYALGATLYQVATGVPPFDAGDPVKLIHDHLARVPVPPADVNAAIPVELSRIIMRLLEKEPDSRYQTADELIHDLSWVRDDAAKALQFGQDSAPLRVHPPSRIIGRDNEIASLGAAFAQALQGGGAGVLVAGPPGAGKTSLVDELRPVVTASGGWFVSGKFDQYRRDLEFDGVHQAFRALGRLLLAQPQAAVSETRRRILHALGHSAGLATAVTPELATLLGVPPDMGDPLTVQARSQRNAVEILRAVASPERPVVFFVDDLQWAGQTPLGFVDEILSGRSEVDGLLLVAAYRDDGPGPTDALANNMSRWQRQRHHRPLLLGLDNLSTAGVAELVADMLGKDVDGIADLAVAIARRMDGNPYQTVELLNTMRREGLLTRSEHGWWWDAAALRGDVQLADLPDLLSARLAALPLPARGLLDAIACLGGRVDIGLLEVATGQRAPAIQQALAPAVEDGLLVRQTDPQDALVLRHDRIQEAVLAGLATPDEHALRLGLARRLASRSDLSAVAAQQYLPVVDAVDQPAERQRVVHLFRDAAAEATLISNHIAVERLLSAAAALAGPTDGAEMIELQTSRMVALFGLGRLDEADEVFSTIEASSQNPLDRTDATLVQVSSLANRSRPAEAISLGIDLLRRLGVAVPGPDEIEAEIDGALDALYRWLADSSESDDLARPEVTDPTVLAAASLINRMMPPTFQSDLTTMAWLVLHAARMWAQHGPGRTLVGPVSHIAFIMTRRRQDYRTGYHVTRRVIAVGQARGYEPDTSQARFLFAFGAGHWFEPLEECVRQARQALEGLLQGGDLQNACWTADVLVYALWDCAPTLGEFLPDVEAALALARRTGNHHSTQLARPYLWLAEVLSGDTAMLPVDEDADVELLQGNPTVASNVHIAHAIAAALLNDPAKLDEHSAAAMDLLPFIENIYPSAAAFLTRALALAGRAQASPAGSAQHAAIIGELDSVVAWWAVRANDAPTNFRHLWSLVEAERAWAVDDFRGAVRAFDAAHRAASEVQRPWHLALIAERAARFHLAYGVERTGQVLLADAERAYASWGAAVKVRQLQQADRSTAGPPTTQPGATAITPAHRASIMTGAIDLLGILDASHTLSSTTSLDGLRKRVVEILSDMTGATGVNLLLWDERRESWLLAGPGADATTISLDAAGPERLIPLSAVQYVARTREPLLVGDAVMDDRFAADPYFEDYECCSLLVVPILNRGALQALLVLENRLIRDAFSSDRLDGVILIAGQLAVSLDNAQVYASLEQKVAERTTQLALANQRLEQLSITDVLTGVANRRRFQEVLDAEWYRARSGGRPLALAIVDIDHFKRYNDHYGHPSGDQCLRRVALQLERSGGANNLVARYGGEEFAVVMPDTGLGAAREVAERLRAAVASLAEPHEAVADGVVTTSIGIAATTPTTDTSPDQLLEQADAALYRAKRTGRNRVTAASPVPGG